MSTRIKELEELIIFHNNLYTNSQPEISDTEYDLLVKELKELDPNNSTLLVVGAEPSYGKKIKHDIIMGSLNKATYDDKDDISELEKFYRTYHLAQSRWSWKIDGLAAELVYKKGKLVEASTRGNGEVGSDITDNAMAISFIPKNVAKFKNINLTRIRGEIYLPISEYKKNFSHMANPRNAAAGILIQQDASETGKAGLKFFAYKVFNEDQELISLDTEKLQLEDTGIPYIEIHDEILTRDKILELEELRKTFDFQTDGIVVMLNERKVRNYYGLTGKNLRAAIAWKFHPEIAQTYIRDIEWNVGRTGVITPVAIMDPVSLAGTIVSRSTLHNLAQIKKLGINIGCKVKLLKAGDIIPKIIAVIPEPRIYTPIAIPHVCPGCGAPTIQDDIKLSCTNDDCPAKLAANILRYFRALDVKDVGEATIELMIEHKMIRNFADLYDVTPEMLLTLDRMGERSSQLIVDAIHSIKDIPLNKFLTSLGITNLGNTSGKHLAIAFGTLDKVLNASIVDISSIEGIGDVASQNIYDGLKAKTAVIARLRNILTIQDHVQVQGAFTGKNFVCTGTLSRPRKVIQDKIAKMGGNYGSINKDLNYLIIGEGAVPAKIEKAKKYGAEVLTEEEFSKICK